MVARKTGELNLSCFRGRGKSSIFFISRPKAPKTPKNSPENSYLGEFLGVFGALGRE
jgi:hypothetical protein